MKQQHAGFAASFGMASAWFGLHCGGGFATGAQGVVYFTGYGAWELISTFVAAALMGIYAYVLWEYCRVAKTYNYHDAYRSIFAPHSKIFASIHEVLYLMILFMAMGSVFSGAANVAQTIVPQLNYPVAVSIIALIVFALTIFGDQWMLRFSSVLSVLLISSVVIMTVAGIAASPDVIVDTITNWKTGDKTFFQAMKAAVVYAGFQTTVMVGTVGLVSALKTHRDTKWAGFFGFLVNFVLMLLVSTMMLGFYPGVIGEQLPIKHILDGIGIPALSYIYYLALYLACITTGITLVYSLVKRFEPMASKFIQKPVLRRQVLSISVIAICFVISLAGLLAIIGKGYGMVGYLSIPLVYLPTLLIAPIKRRRLLSQQNMVD